MAGRRVRRCEFCTKPLPKDARANQKFCDADCRRGRSKAAGSVVEQQAGGEVLAALEESITEAKRLNRLDTLDASAIAAARVLARKIDQEQDRWDYCLKWQHEAGADGRGRPKPPPIDNVSLPTYLRYIESLGLSPGGRKPNLANADDDSGGSGGSTSGIAGLAQEVPRPGK